jgi:hypothetical protein
LTSRFGCRRIQRDTVIVPGVMRVAEIVGLSRLRKGVVMCAKAIFAGFIFVLVLFVFGAGSGATWYVDGSLAASGDGRSWETAFQKIQEGIDAAADGDTVVVAEGTYAENVKFNGKDIVLQSTDPLDSGVVEGTVISRTGSVVGFAGTEDGTCILAGFTIRNGNAPFGGGICGGTEEVRTQANIRNNIITNNRATANGAGIAYCDGIIEYNTISNNAAAGDGGGLYWCHGTIQFNTISGNSVTSGAGGIGTGGGGLAYCHGAIQNNTITGNNGRWGGGLILCDGIIQNNTISRNTAAEGAGLCLCDALIQNNIIVRNSCSGPFGGGLDHCNGIIRNNTIAGNSGSGGSGLFSCRGTTLNCIIWGNTGSSQIYDAHETRYSCIEGWTAGGEGNIAADPGFVDSAGDDYRLSGTSPCIDKGKNEDWMWQAVDLGGNPRILKGKSSMKVDMGAYEYVAEPVVVKTWHVNASAPEGGDGTSWETAFAKIQEGIDAASPGDTVMVRPGTYTENIRFNGKNIVIRSTDALGNRAVSDTIIEGNEASSVVTFAGTEDETSSLSGFTIRNGSADSGGGIYGGSLKKPTRARIENNVIAGNSASGDGGGLAYCAGPILNNTISGNQGGGLYYCSGSIHNCIIWGNTDGEQVSQSSIPTYSCIEGWTLGGEGNMDKCPYFASVLDGDYRLLNWSPCIDRGDPGSPFSAEPEPNGGRINIGAYGNTLEAASRSPDGDSDELPDEWEMQSFGHLAWGRMDDPDSDLVSNLHEYYRGTDPTTGPPRTPGDWYVDGSVAFSAGGTTPETAFKTVQEGIDAAFDGDTVIVAEGTYLENIRLKGKNITVRSTDPLDPAVVAGTIIDGDQAGSVVTFVGTEDEMCVLAGFTIRNGSANTGGGICGGVRETHARSTIRNNIITDNLAVDCGGGLAFCDGVVQDNRIANSSATGGGALAYCHGIIRSNVISDNSAETGGGLYYCDATIQANIISGNSATSTATMTLGGGLCRCDGAVQSNLICGNAAVVTYGGGGGLSFCAGHVRNNTIVANRSNFGGGIAWCYGTFRNCIIWGNSAGTDAQQHGFRDMTYTCIQGGAAGEGNITTDPAFADADGPDDNPNTYEDNNYRLSEGSLCIDRGVTEDWMADAVDLDNNPRVWHGKSFSKAPRVDIGAYEYGSFPFEVVGLIGDGGEAQLTWNSRPGQSYTMQSCADLVAGEWIVEAVVPSGGDSTTWSDSDTTSARKFYRIELK